MMKRRARQRGGSTLIEFTLVGVPLIFALISIFELCRGMWIYDTLAATVKTGARYAVVHGQNCSTAGNTCAVTIAQIAARMQNTGVGLLPDQLSLTFTPSSGSAITCTMTNCLANNTAWPPSSAYGIGNNVTIYGSYPFRSMISMLWPDAGKVNTFGAVTFGATSKERIQF